MEAFVCVEAKKEAPKLLLGYQPTPLLENHIDSTTEPGPSPAPASSSDQSLAVTTCNEKKPADTSANSYKVHVFIVSESDLYLIFYFQESTALIIPKKEKSVPTPQWHAPWELSAVISGHLGWVRSIAFDPSNEWFVTGSADRTIKVRMFYVCI
jgi:WD40 repeat protein